MTIKKELREILYYSLASIFITFLISLFYFQISQNKYIFDLNIWLRWDTLHYLNLAENGYLKASLLNHASIPYMPLFPWLIRSFTLLTNSYLLSSLLIANVSFLIAIYYLYKIVRLDYDDEVSWKTVVYLVSFPTAYFLHAGYSESLYMATLFASVYYARLGKWKITGILGFLATLTRLNGIVIFIFLITEYFQSVNFDYKKIKKNILWLGLVPVAFCSYLILNKKIFGNPFEYMDSLKTDYWEFITVPWYAIVRSYNKFFVLGPRDWIMEGGAVVVSWIYNILMAFAGLFKKIRLSYSVYVLLSLGLVTLTPTWASMPRFALPIFPLFISLALISKSKSFFIGTVSLFILLQAVFLYLFIQGNWAF